jgi:hypothetical protein
MRPFSTLRLFTAVVLVMAVLLFGAIASQAAQYEPIKGTIVVAAGATSKTIWLPMEASVIKDVNLFIPTLGATDSTSLTMRMVPFSSAALTTSGCELTPIGWTDYRWAATANGTTVTPFSSAPSIPVSGRLKLTFKTKHAQSVARTVQYCILREY